MGDVPRAEELFSRLFKTTAHLEDGLDLASVQPAQDAYESLLAIRKSTRDPVDPRLDLALADAATRWGASLKPPRRHAESKPCAVGALALVLAAALRAGRGSPMRWIGPSSQHSGRSMRQRGSSETQETSARSPTSNATRRWSWLTSEPNASLPRVGCISRGRFLSSAGREMSRGHIGGCRRSARVLAHGGVAEADDLFRQAKEEIDAVGEQPDPSFWAASGWTAMYAGDLPRAKSDLARFHTATGASQSDAAPFRDRVRRRAPP